MGRLAARLGYSISAQHRPQTVTVDLGGLCQFRTHLRAPITGSPGRRRFCWLLQEPGVDPPANPAAGVQAPEVPLPPVPVVPDDRLKAVLATCGTGSFVDLRVAAQRLLTAVDEVEREVADSDADAVTAAIRCPRFSVTTSAL